MKYKIPIREKLLILTVLGLTIVLIGACCNFVVIQKHSGRMPVLSNYKFDDDTHFSYTKAENEKIEYNYLSDKFHIFNCTWSIGDFLLVIGALCCIINLSIYVVVICVMVKRQNNYFAEQNQNDD